MGTLEELVETNKALIACVGELKEAVRLGIPTLAAYSYETCAKMLDGVSEQTVRRLVDRGLLKRIDNLGTPRVCRDSFWKFVESGEMLRVLHEVEKGLRR